MSILGEFGQLLKFSLFSFVVPGSAPSKSNSAHYIHTHTHTYNTYGTYIHTCEGRDEAMASGGVILETKK